MAGANPISIPFPRLRALSTAILQGDSDERSAYLPGDLSIDLVADDLRDYLEQELSTAVIDELYDSMWLVARKGGHNVDSLSRQRVKEREIIPTNEIRLHLTWYHQKIYLKPILVCLFNYEFWKIYLSPSTTTRSSKYEEIYDLSSFQSAAIGFVRSYAFLVRSQLDFVLAQQAHLIPSNIEWENWSAFIKYFRNIDDIQVSRRFHYGQLRLSRLNWAGRVFQPPSASTAWFYEIPHWSIRAYTERALAPLLFGFASLSSVLSCMQVMLAVPVDGLGIDGVDNACFEGIRRAFWGFSILVLLTVGVIWVLLCMIPFGAIIWQLLWGFRHRGKKLRQDA